VFGEPAATIDCRTSGKRNTRRSLLSKVQRRLQRKTDDELVTEGGEGMSGSNTLPW